VIVQNHVFLGDLTPPFILQSSLLVSPHATLQVYFINESSKKKKSNGHLNFERLWIVSECLSAFMMHKQNVAILAFAAVPAVQSVLTTAPVCSELELFTRSVENEPPDKKDGGKTMGRLRKMSSSNLSSDGEGTPSGKGSPEAAL
jgi:hypothetical protein